MQDHNFNDIITEVHKQFPLVPRKVVYWVCRKFLAKIYMVLGRPKSRIRIQRGDINAVYHSYNIMEHSAEIADLDETHETYTPSIVFRSKINPKRIHHPRLGPDPIYKRRGK